MSLVSLYIASRAPKPRETRLKPREHTDGTYFVCWPTQVCAANQLLYTPERRGPILDSFWTPPGPRGGPGTALNGHLDRARTPGRQRSKSGPQR